MSCYELLRSLTAARAQGAAFDAEPVLPSSEGDYH